MFTSRPIIWDQEMRSQCNKSRKSLVKAGDGTSFLRRNDRGDR